MALDDETRRKIDASGFVKRVGPFDDEVEWGWDSADPTRSYSRREGTDIVHGEIQDQGMVHDEILRSLGTQNRSVGDQIGIWSGYRTGTNFELHAQQAIEELLGLEEGQTLTSIDIENIGSLVKRSERLGGKKAGADFFGVTELGLQSYKVKKNRATGNLSLIKPKGVSGIGLVVGLQNNEVNKIKGIIDRIKNARIDPNLTSDEYRSVYDLMKYSDPTKFITMDVGGRSIKVVTGHAEGLPTYMSSLKTHWKTIQAGLDNMMDKNKTNSLDEMIKSFNHYVSVNSQTHKFVGFNQNIYDFPTLLENFGRPEVSGLVKDKHALSVFNDTLRSTRSLDMFQVVKSIYPDFGEFINDRVSPLVPSGNKFIPGATKGMSLENIMGYFGKKFKAHEALADVRASAQLFNLLSRYGFLNPQQIAAQVAGSGVSGASNMVQAIYDKIGLRVGDIVLSSSGANASGVGIYDLVTRGGNKVYSYDPAAKRQYNNSIFANTYYKIQDFWQKDVGGRQKYGLVLQNLQDPTLTHTIVRENMADLQSFVHGGFNAVKMTQKQFETANTRLTKYHATDNARRAFLRLFESNPNAGYHGYSLLDKYLKVYNEVKDVAKDQRPDAIKVATEKHFDPKYIGRNVENFTRMYDRFAAEAPMIESFIGNERFKNLSPYQKDLALSFYREGVLGDLGIGVLNDSTGAYRTRSDIMNLPPEMRQMTLAEETFNLASPDHVGRRLRGIAYRGVGKKLTVGEATKMQVNNLTNFLGGLHGQLLNNDSILRQEYLGGTAGPGFILDTVEGYIKQLTSGQVKTTAPIINSMQNFLYDTFSNNHNLTAENVFAETKDIRGFISPVTGTIKQKHLPQVNAMFESALDKAAKISGHGGNRGTWMANLAGDNHLFQVISAYDETKERILAGLGGAANNFTPTPDLKTSLVELANAYRSATDDVEVMFLTRRGTKQHTGLIMAIMAKNKADEVRKHVTSGRSLRQIADKVALVDLPLMDTSGLIKKGRVSRVNQFYFKEEKGKYYLQTGVDRIFEELSRGYNAKAVRQAIVNGNSVEASRIATRAVNKAITNLSGSSSYVDLRQENSLIGRSKMMNWIRGGIVHLDDAINMGGLRGLIEGMAGQGAIKANAFGRYDIDSLTIAQKMSFLRNLKGYFGNEFDLHLNFQSVKDTQATKSLLNTRDIRDLLPFSDYTLHTNFAAYQALNAYDLDPTRVKSRGVQNPFTTTEKAFEITEGQTPYFTMKAAEMGDQQLTDMIDQAIVRAENNGQNGLAKELRDLKGFSSTYEGNMIMSDRMKLLFKQTQTTVDAIEVGAGNKFVMRNKAKSMQLRKGDIVGHVEDARGKLLRTVKYMENQSGRIAFHEFDDATKIATIQYEKKMHEQIGTKIMTSHGDKFTVGSFWKNHLFEAVFGKEASDIGAVVAPAHMKHLTGGAVIDKNIKLGLYEVNKAMATVGDAQKQDIIKEVNAIIQKNLGNIGEYKHASEFGGAALFLGKQAGAGITIQKLQGFLKDIGNMGIINKDLTRGVVTPGGNISVGVYSFLRPIVDEDTTIALRGGKGSVKYGFREREMLRGRGKAGENVAQWILNHSTDKSAYHQQRYTDLSKANKALMGIGPQVDDKVFLTDARQSFANGVRLYDPQNAELLIGEIPKGDVFAPEAYRNTILGAHEENGKWKSRGGWFELPEEVTIQHGDKSKSLKYVNFVDDKFSVLDDGRATLSELQTAQANVFTASHNYRQLRAGGAETGDIEKAYRRLTGAVQGWSDKVGKAVTASKGELAGDMMTAKFSDYAGRGRLKIMNAAMQTAGPAPIEEGTWFVSERMARDMLHDAGNKEYVESLIKEMKAKDGKGIIGMANRFPTMYETNVTTARFKVLPDGHAMKDALDASHSVYMTVGDAMLMKGDQDGDWLSMVFSHYKRGMGGQRADQVITDLETIHEQSLGERRAAASKEINSYLTSMGEDLGMQHVTTLNQIMGDRDPAKAGLRDRLANLVAYKAGVGAEDIITQEARLLKSYTGIFSNLGTKMRRVATSVAGVQYQGQSVLTVGNAVKLVHDFGAKLEQEAISAKKLHEKLNLGAPDADERLVAHLESREKLRSAITQMGGKNSRQARQTILDQLDTMGVTGDFGSHLDALEEVGRLAGGTGGWGNVLRDPAAAHMLSGGVESPEERDLLMQGRAVSKYSVPTAELSETIIKSGNATYQANFQTWQEDFSNNVVQRYLSERRSGFRQGVQQEGIGTLEDVMSRMTIGQGMTSGMMRPMINISGGGAGAIAGTAAFLGASFIHNFTKKNPIPPEAIPQHDQAPLSDGSFIPTPSSAPPKKAYIQTRGSGYENLNLSIRASDMSGLSQEQIAQLVTQEVNKQMPIQTNVNVTTNDNTRKIDRRWVEEVLANSL